MDHLIDGYRRFRARQWPRQRQRFAELAQRGQRPRTMVIACSDSRVDPQMIFNAGPGELFVVRNVANLVPPYQPDAAYHGTSAALEFGVRGLGCTDIVVLGHGLCGGVKALLEGAPAETGDFVAPWMSLAAPARDRTIGIEPAAARQQACEHETVRLSLAYLWTFPWIREAATAGRLALHGCWSDVGPGILMRPGSDGAFRPVPTPDG